MSANNSISLVGRLTKELAMNKTQSGLSVCNFTLAVDRYNADSDFINCQAWRQTADFLTQYATTGDLIALQGSLKVEKYEDKLTGKTVWKTLVVVDSAKLLSNKKKEQTNERPEPKADNTPQYTNDIDINSDDLPF